MQLVAHALGVPARRALADVADAAAHARRIVADVAARDDRLARRGRQQRGEHAERGRLAGAVRAEEGDELPLLHGEVDGTDGLDGRALRAERLREASGGDHLVRHIGQSSEPSGQFPSSLRRYLGHGRHHHEDPRTPLTPAEPPALVGARTRRSPRRERAHAAPRRRAPARARVRHRVDARQRRRVPARGGHRPAAAPAHRRRGGRHRGRTALAGDRRPARRRAHHAQRPRQDRAGAAARAAPAHRRAGLACDGRRGRARRRRPPGARGRRRAARPARPRLPRLRAAAVQLHGCRGRVLVARRRALPARARRPPLVPPRLGPPARGLAHVPARPHQRRLPDASALRAATDERRGGAGARRDRAALARSQRAGPRRDRRAEGRPRRPPRLVRARRRGRRSGPLRVAARGRHRREPRDGADVGAARTRPTGSRARPRCSSSWPRRPSGSAQPLPPGRTDPADPLRGSA